MGVDWQALGTVSGSMAGFAIIGKWLMRGVEKSNETLPVIIESLKNTNEAIKTTNEGMKILFDSRYDHERRLERVETTHDIRGCNEPLRRSTDH